MSASIFNVRFLRVMVPVIFLVAFIFSASTSVSADATPNPARSKISFDSVNLSAEDFFRAYFSDDQKENVLFYLLGVLDTTEGKVWCNYKSFKTITLRENIFEYIKALSPERSKERASAIIAEVLYRDFPCRSQQ